MSDIKDPQPLRWVSSSHDAEFMHFTNNSDIESAVAWLKQQIKDSAICNNKDDSKSIKIYMNKLIDEAFGLEEE